MLSVRRFLTVTSTILGLAVLASPASAARAPAALKSLTVTKECGTATLASGELEYCTITETNFPALNGAKIRYFGPGFFTADHPYLDSWVVIEGAQGGGTAFGHCLVRAVPGVLGACEFTGGSGSLKGFKADVTVTTVDGTLFNWIGALAN